MLVIKFGGSSLADCERIMRAAGVVVREARGDNQPVLTVVSALGDTTDLLLEASGLAEAGDALGASAIVQRLRAYHEEVCLGCELPAAATALMPLFSELSSILEGVRLLREVTPRSRALIASFGERLSAPLVAAAVQLVSSGEGGSALVSPALDAREIIVTDAAHDDAQVKMPATRARVQKRLLPLLKAGQAPVITGFLAADENGITTTLGRGGSDYTATLLGALLAASEIHIYTDVDGVLTADPRLVKEARTLPEITYREAAEMSYFGARVLHPRTILPAADAKIPVRVRSSFLLDQPGTRIGETAPTLPHGVKTVTSIADQAIVSIEGRGMSGVLGVARRIFEAAERSSTNVVMISQASSEQTVSLVVPQSDAPALVEALSERFSPELARGDIERVTHRDRVAVLSIIGKGMAGTPGIAGKLFSALGAAQVNVLAIAQGSSELSISVAVDAMEMARAVRAAHSAFGLTRVLNILLCGAGGVGKTLLRLLNQTRRSMHSELDLELRVVGVATSKKLLFDSDGLDPGSVSETLAGGGGEARPDDAGLIAKLVGQRFTDMVLVDVSAADTVDLHKRALNAGVHVVTANKRPLAGSLASYRELFDTSRQRGRRYQYETTFGAGLPVLHALQELVNTGDRVVRVVGCLSGTLGFITSRLDEGAELGLVVAQAEDRGFTEPDPREDLSGRDVARKALIIARACGFEVEPEDVELTPLVPGLEGGLAPACAAFAATLDAEIAAAKANDEVLRYVADIRPGSTKVGLQRVAAAGPIGSLRGPDNILVFQTARYDEFPLVIRGPGAGSEVTAAGVLGDVLKVARRI